MNDTPACVYKHDSFGPSVAGALRFGGGPRPGEPAPDFDLATTTPGGRFRLSARRGRSPVLVTFGCLTCPLSIAALDALRSLHDEFRGRAELVTVYVREMHPGERRPQPSFLHEKVSYAREWVRLDAIPWTVAVDRLDGEVHRAYGTLPCPAYVVDSRGLVAFRSVWAGQRRPLRHALERVLDIEGRGLVATTLGEKELSPLSFVHGTRELETALARGGAGARENYRRSSGGGATAGLQRLLAGLEEIFRPSHRRTA